MKSCSALLALGLLTGAAMAQSTTSHPQGAMPHGTPGTPDAASPAASPKAYDNTFGGRPDAPRPATAAQPQPPAVPAPAASPQAYDATFQERPGMANPEAATRPEERTANGVTWKCGGVGEEEAAEFRRSARDYDMMLTFATREGLFLADVDVDIADSEGNSLVRATCAGPMMLVDFARGGTYKVRAESGGYSLDRTARVADRPRRTASLLMHWPQQDGGTSAIGSTGSSGNAGSGDRGK